MGGVGSIGAGGGGGAEGRGVVLLGGLSSSSVGPERILAKDIGSAALAGFFEQH